MGEPGDPGRGMFSLEGRRALITGAARGLGLEIAIGLSAAGAQVILNGRQQASLEAAADLIGRKGGVAEVAAFDVRDEEGADQLLARGGPVDILVNNVGARDRRDLFSFERTDIERLLAIDLVAPLELSRKLGAGMRRRRYGRIVNVSSVAARQCAAGDALYATAKGGLEAMTRALAAEFGPYGVTVNAIAPGFFATETNAALAEAPEVGAWLTQRTALGRWGRPAEIAGAVVFLASDAASYVTGQVLVVDGGLSVHL